MRLSSAGDNFKQDHGKEVAPRFQSLAAVNFESLLGARTRREEGPEAVFGGLLFRSISEHKETGLVVLSLPGMKKVVGRGEGGDIARIRGGSSGRFGLGGESPGKRRQTEPKKSESGQYLSSRTNHHREISRPLAAPII